MKRKLSLFVLVVLLFAAVPVLAGGWAVVSMDEMPGEIHAGEPMIFTFMVRQHGETPVHFLGGDETLPITPILQATNPETGDSVRVEAERGEEVGRFTVEVTFPTEGTWEWSIAPNPLMVEGVFPPLTVLAPIAVNPTVNEAVEQPAVIEPAPVVPAAQESAAPAPTATTTTSASESILRSGLQLAAVALLVVAIALLLIQRRGSTAGKLGAEGSGD